MASRVGPEGHVLCVDRSETAIDQVRRYSADLVAEGRLSARVAAVETFELDVDEEPFELALAVRVGVLDGRHPARRDDALARIAAALVPGGRLFIDGGEPLVEVALPG
jgi:SAM-dependent methyltransferase